MSFSNKIRRLKYPEMQREELKWFSSSYLRPKTRLSIPEATLNNFQKIIWDNESDDILPEYGTECSLFWDKILA